MTAPIRWFGTTDNYPYSHIIRTEQPHWCAIRIWQSELWYDLLPTFVNVVNGQPIDFSSYVGLDFDLWITPGPGHATVIDHLQFNNGIYVDAILPGRIHISRPRDTIDDYPVGKWFQSMSMTWTDPDYGVATKLLWYGPMHVFAARYVPPAIIDTSMGAGGGNMLGAGGGDTIGVD